MRYVNKDSFLKSFEGQIDPFLLVSFWNALGSDYFKRFGQESIALHLNLLQDLHIHPWKLDVRHIGARRYQITWVGQDKLGLFALLSGVLAGLGYSIAGGDLFSFCLDPEDAAVASNDNLYNRPIALDVLEFSASADLKVVQSKLSEQFEQLIPVFQTKGLDGVRSQLQYSIGNQLSQSNSKTESNLVPLDIQFRNTSERTTLLVNGEDSPAFLFILSTVLSMRGLNVRAVKIRTRGHRVIDKFSLVDRQGKPIEQPSTQEAVRRDVLMVKQFIHFLNQASDYQLAFQNFFHLLQKAKGNIWEDEQVDFHDFFSKLAKILGTGSFMWEEFSRIQFKELRPMLADDEALKKNFSKEDLELIINGILASDPFAGIEDKVKALNQFKNKELFRLDLKHLVFNECTFEDFSRELGDLAEVSLAALYHLGYDHLSKTYGVPVLNDEELHGALLAFGKFGGYELGYASDLEVVFVYEGNGKTVTGKREITNQEFFNKLVQWMNKSWAAKSDGIFELDWRLRPYGEKGSWSASIEFWENYYSDESKSHIIEVQAMTKMRAIVGSEILKSRIEEFRDKIVYFDRDVDKEAMRKMRQVQLESHLKSKKLNAKYSPGALVDIEYTVQYLQMEHGKVHPELRQTNVLKSLRALLKSGILNPTLFEKLNNAYAFQRRLINALRIVRGNAKDLELPDKETSEWEFLERRMGYFGLNRNPYGSTLKDDMNFHFHQVALFYDEYFNGNYHEVLHRGGLPELLEGHLSMAEAESVLAHYGVTDFEKSQNLLQRIYDFAVDQESLMSILVIAARNIRNSANPEGVLLNIERFLSRGDENEDFFRRLLENPEVLRQIILIFSTSGFLSGVVEQDPESLFDLNETEALWKKKAKSELKFELENSFERGMDIQSWIDQVRQFRNKEYLRIFLRDFDLKVPMYQLTEEISDLSFVLAEVVFEKVFADADESETLKQVEIVALGKLGARELNYSSDIDLVYYWNDDVIPSDAKYTCEKLLRKAMRLMTATSQYGQLFRVDTALRPHGQQGGLIASRKHYLEYYNNEAQGWELQAWLKASPFWNRESAKATITQIQSIVKDESRSEAIYESIRKMRFLVLERNSKHQVDDKEIKNGIGGIRTLEFYLQQKSIEWSRRPDFKLSGNSLRILYHGQKLKLVTKAQFKTWSEDYIFLRKVEHLLQIDLLQQKHLIPDSPKDLEILAKRMGYRSRLEKSATDLFMGQLKEVQVRVTKLHEEMYRLTPEVGES